MGYYTNYELSYKGNIDSEQLLQDLNDITEYGWKSNLRLYEVKWYDWKAHMKILSKKYPDVLFELEGNGEDQGDHWIAYFKDGKVQVAMAEVTFEPFDEGKLK